MKSQDYWRGYMAALEDAARELSDACVMAKGYCVLYCRKYVVCINYSDG
jgi:hypothetical protein